jgi:hypothetical protein
MQETIESSFVLSEIIGIADLCQHTSRHCYGSESAGRFSMTNQNRESTKASSFELEQKSNEQLSGETGELFNNVIILISTKFSAYSR